MKPCWSCTESTAWKIYILICCCYYFKINFFVCLTLFSSEAGYTEIIFLIWAKWIFLWVHLDRQNKKHVFLCAFIFFLCGLTHRKISFNLGEHNFFCACETHRKIISDGEPIEKFDFSVILFLCIIYRQKNIFPWVFEFFCGFLHTQKYSSLQ